MSGKAACPVLRGAGVQLEYGRDIVAPPRKQAANGENKRRPVAPGDSCLLEAKFIEPGTRNSAGTLPSKSFPRSLYGTKNAWTASSEKLGSLRSSITPTSPRSMVSRSMTARSSW